MNYETEPWYKLYLRESTEDKLLPVLNRALRDFLLRLAKNRIDATILRNTTSPGEDLARALGATGAEAETIADYVRSMLVDGYLSHRRGRLWITNFVDAQAARTPGARRQKTYRDNQKKSRNGHVTESNGAAPALPDSDVTGDARITLQTIREEKRREEERRDDPTRVRATAPAATAPDSDPEAPERETVCPLDLLSRPGAAPMLREMSEKLPAPIAHVEAEAAEIVGYYTIGGGKGQKRSNWFRVVRERIRKRFMAGELGSVARGPRSTTPAEARYQAQLERIALHEAEDAAEAERKLLG